MSYGQCHGLCRQYKGRAVDLRTSDGRAHRGVITRVDNNTVYLMPQGRARNLGGFGYGYGYGGYGYRPFRPGLGVGIAVGVIVGVALASLFFI